MKLTPEHEAECRAAWGKRSWPIAFIDWRAGFAAGLAARDGDGLFPRSSSADREAGWTLEFSFLKTIADTTAEMDADFSVSMEQAEFILLPPSPRIG